MNRAVGAALLAWMLVAAGAARAENPWEEIWFNVPVDENRAVHTGTLLGIAHSICQGLGGRHYRSGSSRLVGPAVFAPKAAYGLVRPVRAACTTERESTAKR